VSDSAREGEGFLQRWSRRKAGIATAADEAAAAASRPATAVSAAALATAPDAEPAPPTRADDSPAAPPEPLPTLADVAALTPGADVTRFMRPGSSFRSGSGSTSPVKK
jgi:hypothetical protein